MIRQGKTQEREECTWGLDRGRNRGSQGKERSSIKKKNNAACSCAKRIERQNGAGGWWATAGPSFEICLKCEARLAVFRPINSLDRLEQSTQVIDRSIHRSIDQSSFLTTGRFGASQCTQAHLVNSKSREKKCDHIFLFFFLSLKAGCLLLCFRLICIHGVLSSLRSRSNRRCFHPNPWRCPPLARSSALLRQGWLSSFPLSTSSDSLWLRRSTRGKNPQPVINHPTLQL